MPKAPFIPYKEYGFRRVGEGDSAVAECLFCPKVLSNTGAKRLRNHQTKCPKTGRTTRKDNVEDSSEDEEPTPSKKSKDSSEPNATPVRWTEAPEKVKKQLRMDNFGDRMSKKEGSEARMLLADFFFANRLPFRLFEDDYFRKLLAFLRPAFTQHMPCRRSLGGQMLDECVERYKKKEISENLENYCVLIDGWKNKITKDKWLCFVLQKPGCNSIYLKSVLMTDIKETKDNLTEEVSI